MTRCESVIFPSTEHVQQIQRVATLFAQQYGSVQIWIRGSVIGLHETSYLIPTWRRIGMLDLERDLVGLGNIQNQDEEDYIWVSPTKNGEIQLSMLVESQEIE